MGLPSKSLHVRHYVQTDDSVPRMFDAYYYTTDSLDSDTLWDDVISLTTQAYTAMLGAMTGGWLALDSRYLGCTGHLNYNDLIFVHSEINVAGAVGEETGDTLPDYAAGVIRRYTASVGPAGRGRVFVPAVAELNSDTSRLNADGLTAIALVRDALNTELTTDHEFGDQTTWTAAHYDRKNDLMRPVSHWLPVRTLVTQRRRRLRPLQ